MGDCAAADFHATYAGVAETMQPGDDPVVVWGMPAAHFCLGQHQSALAELIEHPQVPVIRRPLGGGGVWLDSHQACVVLVAPREFFPVRPQHWYAHGLAPILQVYREMGWAVTLVQQDIWFNSKKLAGSGAASIGAAGLVGTSFLLKFPIVEFARLIASPSAGFRLWLQDALQDAISSWSDYAAIPDLAWLSLVYRRAATSLFGWRWAQALLRDDERSARDAFHDELIPERDRQARQVPYGIKIRAQCYLTERNFNAVSVRVLTLGQHIGRVALSSLPQLPERALSATASTPTGLRAVLQAYLPGAEAEVLAQQILATAFFEEM